MTNAKDCSDCGEHLPLTSFYRNGNGADGFLARCKQCVKNRWRESRKVRAAQNRAKIQAIKLERGCVDCGYNSHPAALDFDHLPQFEKEYRVCSMAGMKWSKVLAEIAKCEVRCANCHRIKTAERRQDGSTSDS